MWYMMYPETSWFSRYVVRALCRKAFIGEIRNAVCLACQESDGIAMFRGVGGEHKDEYILCVRKTPGTF